MIKKALEGLLFTAFVLGSAALCQAGMTSENYRILRSAQSGGGAFVASENYVMFSTLRRQRLVHHRVLAMLSRRDSGFQF